MKLGIFLLLIAAQAAFGFQLVSEKAIHGAVEEYVRSETTVEPGVELDVRVRWQGEVVLDCDGPVGIGVRSISSRPFRGQTMVRAALHCDGETHKISGLGSGLDTDLIISQLVDIERRPLVLIQRRQVRLEQQKGLIKAINSNLLNLKGSVEKLEDDDLFSIVKARSSDTSKVGVAATNEAAAGTFNVEVLELSQAQSISSRSFSNLTDALSFSGEIVINGEGVAIDEDDGLVDIRSAINDANAGVSAQILTVASGDNRLILTAEQVGKAGFDLKDASETNVLQGLGFTSSDVSIKNAFVNGARSAQFLAEDESLGSLLNLSSPPSSTVTIGDQEIAIDLAVDTLADVRDKINTAALAGVTADVVTSNQGGIDRFQLGDFRYYHLR